MVSYNPGFNILYAENPIVVNFNETIVTYSSTSIGGDVNAQAPNGDSVLYDAAGSGNPDCVDLLLQNGANPNIANLSTQLPIHRAAYEGHYL